MYLISAYFDDKTRKVLQRYMDAIAKKTGNDYMITHQVPPHLTIAAIEAKNSEVLLPGFRQVSEKITEGSITIVSVGMLLPYVLYAAPVLNEYLQNLSACIAEVYANVPEVSLNRYYRPMQWLPHITLGKQLTQKQMQAAVEIMQRQFTALEGKVTSIGLAEVNPHRDVETIRLV
ncbi:MAG: 2'-5' RNA ligase family protein [Lachnospiraceae bacterium]|nr:2'-5' RNA ligase family protein [Lachnospiraceae bacterium]